MIRNGIGVAKLTKVWEQNHGVGTDNRVDPGLATKLEINSHSEQIDNPGAMTSVRMPSVATSKKLKIDVEDVILRNVSDMKGAC